MRHHDLIVIGAGSGNAVVDESFADLDVAIVEEKWFGGTCLNAGCIPSKMLAYTAHVARTVLGADAYDVDARLRAVRWREVRDRVFGRLDAERAQGRQGRLDAANVTVYEGTARFTGPRRLRIDLDGGPVKVSAGQIVVAAGSRPAVPPVVVESGVPYETSDTIMRIDAPPGRLAVLGGGYIAAELAEVFHATGTEITVVETEPYLLGPQDETVAERFTDLARARYDLRLGRELTAAGGEAGALTLTLDDGSTFEADMLLVAAGRIPNGDRLELGAAASAPTTTAASWWTRINAPPPKGFSRSAMSARRYRSSTWPTGRPRSSRTTSVIRTTPSAPTTTSCRPPSSPAPRSPRSARRRRNAGTAGDFLVGTASYADVAYGWAMEDTTGFCKVLAEPGTGRVLGAHIMGPQAAILIQPLVLAMTRGIDALSLAKEPYWIHPALTEVVENALLDLGLDGDA